MEPNQEHDIPAVDQIANGENLQMYKAMIPYFPKNMAMTDKTSRLIRSPI